MRITTETVVGLFMLSALSVFLFMSFKIGIVRFDTLRYAHYVAYFSDVSGLDEKAKILIAGVPVGWVKKLSLVNRAKQVRVDMMIDRVSTLYGNAYGIVRQNGLLGTKYIEIIPGDAAHAILPAGSTLMKPSKPSVAIDELLSTFKEIADNVQQVSLSLRQAIGDKNGVETLQNMITEARHAFKSIHKAADSTQKLFDTNNEKIHNLISNLESLSTSLREKLPEAATAFKEGSDALKQGIKDITASFDKTSQPITEAATKIHSGKGLLGALINDEVMLQEVKTSLHTVKDYFNYIDRLAIDFDVHVESMYGRGNDIKFKDSKGFANVIVTPSEDYFYLAGIVSSYNGIVKRIRKDKQFFDQEGHQMIPDYTELPAWARYEYAARREEWDRVYDAATWNIQLGRKFGRLTFRAGLFESSFGLGVDYDIPLNCDARWTTTFEAYRFYEFLPHTLQGEMKFDIDRPHLRWLNRVFFNDSFYFAFGADDFISKFNANYFVGCGLSFEDNNIKYIVPRVSLGST